MKKIGVILTFFACLISIISISYASFLVDDDRVFTKEVGRVNISMADTSDNKLYLTKVTSQKGFTYDSETNYIITDEAKITLTISISGQDFYDANQLGYNRYYLEFDISDNFTTISPDFIPQVYLSYATRIAYYDVTRTGNKFIASMPLIQDSIFDNNYLNYIVNGVGAGDRNNVSLVIDFTNGIGMISTLNNKTFNLEIGVRKEV